MSMKTKEAIANIVTSSSKIKFNLPVNRCKDMGGVDSSLPTLIIGYEEAMRYIEGFNILEKHYPETNTYWTFKKTERAIDYEADLKSFFATIIRDFCGKNKYQFLDVINMSLTTARKLVKFAKSDDKKLIFNENNRFLYVYCEKYSTVFGFSLSTSDFFGIRPRKIIELFKNNENNRFIYDFSSIPDEVKSIIGEKIDKYMLFDKFFAA